MSSKTTSTTLELSQQDMDKVFSTIDIPACPSMVTEVLAEAQKDDPDMNRLAKVISSDVGMAAIAIKLANSPLFRTGVPASNVSKALARLGTRNIVSLVMAIALRNSMSGLPAPLVEKFWSRASAVATAAGMIGRRQHGMAPDAAYTFALFHDAAIPLMMRRFPNYAEVVDASRQRGLLLIDAEAEFFPCTHPIIGSLLVRNWGLPSVLGMAIRFHHEEDLYDLPEETLPAAALSLIAVTHIAEHLANEMLGEEDLEVGSVHYERALAHFGIGELELADIREDLEIALNDAKN
ncbi:HDOD domain-containing protein [Sulfurimicrobium lacus]|uniref:HDOD domain-containing protein n=1 Tax=Sulfurimicrobium lacus TaxID=2715678 RepID=A0A6F8VE12_9PROT|nr:HDOD domain-containing protein [Sulfurimicrobium lacus]BCB27580.1 HDOD domain-containing protein [Sulfurimicrobium lacus]